MIKNITISNYKLFESFSLTDLPQILLIGGKNHSGKSSLLEAFFLPLDCSNPAMFLRHFKWRGLNNISNDMEDLFSPAYHQLNFNKDIIIEYTLNLSKKRIAYKIRPSRNPTFNLDDGSSIDIEQSSVNISREMEISFWPKIDKQPLKVLLKFTSRGSQGTLDLQDLTRGELLKYNEGVQAAFLDTRINSSFDNARRYDKLNKFKNTEGILNALKILEPNLKSLSTIQIGNQPTIHGDIGFKKQLPLSLMGQGIMRLLTILLVISEVKNGIALIDELENGFHHSVLADIWKVISNYAQANNTQIIATTHSRELVSGAIQGIPSNLRDKFKYMRIDRNKNNFKPKVYDFKTLKVALETDLEIR